MAHTADTTDRDHPISVVVSRFEDELKTLRDHPAWSMNAEETRDAMARITRLEAQLAELQARVVDHGRTIEVESANGAPSTANWWATETNQTRAGAHRKTKFAEALNTDLHEPVRAALADGRLLVDQAEVIIHAVEALPEDLVADEVRRQAQETLIGYAEDHDAKALRILGKRILDILAPEVGEAWEARKLAAEEAEAAAVFRMSEDGHGKAHGRFTVPTWVGEMLHKALLGYAAPRHRAAVDGQAPEPGRPSARKMGQAFCDYVAGYPADHLPHAGWTPGNGSVPAWPADSPARRGPFPPSSAAPPRSWTWAGRPGSTPNPNASPSRWSRAAAPPRAATGHPGCVRSTTTSPGPRADRPTSSTAGCCAPTTTPAPTTRRTP
jgi:hypothetical protein